jgi:nucleoside-diphosphate-sugar epimerase
MQTRVLVTGAGGFIGHHLVTYLVNKGYWVRGVDIKAPEYEPSKGHEFELLDLRRYDNCLTAARGVEEVYHLAADMGGIGYITANHADIARNDTMINVHMLEAARIHGVQRFLYSSSACVYPQHLQLNPDVKPLKEDDAWPADPEEGYGLEKLYMEKLCQYFREDYGLETRTVRFHNVYGPLGTYEGGKEKAPAAISRKVAMLKDGGEIEVWGDGEQTRSFMYVNDCTEGIYRIMRGDYPHPLNLGTDELVTINQLVDIVSEIACKRVVKRHDMSKPQGVRGRNSDNTRLREVLGWEPCISLSEGLKPTYRWIEAELKRQGRVEG